MKKQIWKLLGIGAAITTLTVIVIVLGIYFLIPGPSAEISVSGNSRDSTQITCKVVVPGSQSISATFCYRLKGAGTGDPDFWNTEALDLMKWEEGYFIDRYEGYCQMPSFPGQKYEAKLIVNYGKELETIESGLLEFQTPKQ